MATFDEFFASLDLDEEGNVKKDKTEKGLPFEQIFIKWFLQNDPIWSSIVDGFIETNKKDLGIDLIFKDKDGNKWAVQSKGYSPQTSITKESIDSFISASPTSKFYRRLLIASTDRIGSNAEITLKENKVVQFLLKDFRNASIDFPPTIKELSKVKKRKPLPRRKHQIKAIDEVLEKIENIDRGQVLMACGTGKTLTSLWIKEDFKANQVLVLVPSLNLLSQTLSAWRNNLSDPFIWQCVCSDKTVHKKKNNDSDDNWIKDPSELGIPVTSDKSEIKKFLLKSKSKVLFSTYQSSELIVEVQKDELIPPFDIVFADEAHKCAGKISKDFSYVLDQEKIRANKRLFFTATPRVLSKKIKNQAKKTETEIASMDNKVLFGDVLHSLKFSDAIEAEILTDYQVIVIGVDEVNINEKISKRDFLKTKDGNLIDSETLALQIAIAKGIKKHNLKRMINFHSRIEGAKLFKDTFQKTLNEMPINDRPNGEIICDFIEGKMRTEDRIEKIRDLEHLSENERRILGNAKCLSEGVDVPSLDGVTFVDPKSSEVDIVQAVGRVIRKGKKQKGTILIPIYLQDLNDIEEQVLQSRFSDVWRIIHALKFHDDVLKENIDNLRISLGKRRSKRIGYKGLEKITFDLPTERINKNFIDSISTLLVENTSETWMERYGELLNYKEKHGHTLVPLTFGKLGSWVGRNRTAKDQLTPEKIELLNNIGFIWNVPSYIFRENMTLLKQFKEEHGHINVPPKSGGKLGIYVDNLRRGKYKLTPENIQELNDIGMIWDMKSYIWQRNIDLFKKFKNENGHTNVPYHEKIIGKWISKIRNNKIKLTPEELQELNDIGLIWDPRSYIWKKNITLLKQFKEEHGHTNVPPSFGKLGWWTDHLRRRKDNLTPEEIQELIDIGFVW